MIIHNNTQKSMHDVDFAQYSPCREGKRLVFLPCSTPGLVRPIRKGPYFSVPVAAFSVLFGGVRFFFFPVPERAGMPKPTGPGSLSRENAR